MKVGDNIRQMNDEELARFLSNLCIDNIMMFCEENLISGKINPPNNEERGQLKDSILEFLRKDPQNDGT